MPPITLTAVDRCNFPAPRVHVLCVAPSSFLLVRMSVSLCLPFYSRSVVFARVCCVRFLSFRFVHACKLRPRRSPCVSDNNISPSTQGGHTPLLSKGGGLEKPHPPRWRQGVPGGLHAGGYGKMDRFFFCSTESCVCGCENPQHSKKRKLTGNTKN